MKQTLVGVLALVLAAGLIWLASAGRGAGAASVPSIAPAVGFASPERVDQSLPRLVQPDSGLEPAEGDAPSQRLVVRTPAAVRETVRVQGRVLDARGEPVPGAQVALRRARIPGPEGETFREALQRQRTRKEVLRQASTDAQGAYSIADTIPGRYEFYVSEEGFGGEATLHEIALEHDLEYDFRLSGYLDLGGRVLRAIPGLVQLELSSGSPGPGGEQRYFSGGVRQAEVGDDGEFLFRGLDPGFYVVRVTSPGHGHRSFEFELLESITDAELGLERGLTFAGVIDRAGNTDDRRVYVGLGLTGPVDWIWHQARWYEDASIRFENLIAGTYTLEIEGLVPNKHSRRIRRELTVQLDRDIEDFRYTLEDDVTAWLEVQLPTGAALAYGTMIASNGAEQRTTRIRLSGTELGTRHEQWPRRTGMYGFASWQEQPALKLDVSPGTWDVRVEILGYEPWTRRVEVLEERFVEVVLEPSEGVLVSAEYESEHFRVERRASGSHADWELTVWHNRTWRGSHQPVLGIEQAWIEPGTYDFRITSIDRVERILPGIALTTSAEPFVIRAALAEGLAVRGTIASASGEPRSVALHLARLESGIWKRLEIKQHGGGPRFVFRGLTPGMYRATFDEAGEVLAATWQLGTEDLVDQGVVVGP